MRSVCAIFRTSNIKIHTEQQMNIFLAVILCFGVYLKIVTTIDKRDCKAAVQQTEERQNEEQNEKDIKKHTEKSNPS